MDQSEGRSADGDVMARCAAGCGQALEELYARHAAACLGRARTVLRDDHQAEDAVQEAFLDLWRHADRYDGAQRSVRSWLLMLTHRRAVDRVRTEERRRVTPLGPDDDRPDAAPTPDVRALESVVAERVRGALTDLTPVKREALVLAYWGGCTQREIAERTGVPLGTVKTRMHSALRELGATFRRQPDADRPHDEALSD